MFRVATAYALGTRTPTAYANDVKVVLSPMPLNCTTEFRHWSAATRKSEMFAEAQNSDSTAAQQINRVLTPILTSPSPPSTDGSGSSATTPLAPAVILKHTITSDAVWSVVEALQFMEDTNASQHDFQNNDEIWKRSVQKRHEHYSSYTD